MLKTSPVVDETREMPISKLGMSMRVHYVLARNGIKTLGEIADMSEGKLLGIGRIGPKAVDEVKCCLKKYGMGLRNNEPDPF